EELPPIDLVLISHDHYDHLDEPSVRRLARRFNPRFVVPLGIKAWLADRDITNVKELDWGESTSVNGLRVVCTPAQHGSGRTLLDNGVRSSWPRSRTTSPRAPSRRRSRASDWTRTSSCRRSRERRFPGERARPSGPAPSVVLAAAPGAARLYFGGDSGSAFHFENIARERARDATPVSPSALRRDGDDVDLDLGRDRDRAVEGSASLIDRHQVFGLSLGHTGDLERHVHRLVVRDGGLARTLDGHAHARDGDAGLARVHLDQRHAARGDRGEERLAVGQGVGLRPRRGVERDRSAVRAVHRASDGAAALGAGGVDLEIAAHGVSFRWWPPAAVARWRCPPAEPRHR